MAVGDILQARLISTLHGQTCINTFGYVATATTATFVDLLAGIASQLEGVIAGFVSSEVDLVRWELNRLWPPPRTFTVTQTTTHPTLGAAPSLPTNVAATITKNTGSAGRKWRGRVFIAGIPETAVSMSQLTSSQLGALQNIANAMDASVFAGGSVAAVPALLSYSKTAVNTWSATNITSCRANPIMRNMRRRQIGIGI